jgi:probable DNA metabolism protein
MNKVAYDGSFAGLLTAIFEVYEYKMQDVSCCRDAVVAGSLFGGMHEVRTSSEKAARVLKKLEERLSVAAMTQFYRAFLSELPEIDNSLIRYTRYILSSRKPVENDYTHPDVLLLQQVSRKVHREKHRMEAFVRFQLTGDGLYYSLIQPDYNVLPLISKHFKERYADQHWLIYDTRRKYGLYYDLEIVKEIELDFAVDLQANGTAIDGTSILDEKEELYQQLWRQYFSCSDGIPPGMPSNTCIVGYEKA